MHIKKINLYRFKQFKKTEIDLKAGLSLVVGGNNSGKSSVLQAIATWQFCKTIIEIEKGRKAWIAGSNSQGVGLGIVDFTPLNVPSLSHLWTNLKSQKEKELDGYTLKIRVTWDSTVGTEKFLEIGMSLANDRLFIKTTATNLALSDIEDASGNPINGAVPNVAYLPPFAGITDRESRLTPAMRARLIGQGLSGGVIRNALFDLSEANRIERIRLKGDQTKIKSSDLKRLRESDPWELLQKAMQDIYGTDIRLIPFNERYHSYLRVECAKGETKNGQFKRYPNYSFRDLMVEGSGFLQWLSVYALTLTPDVDIVLLDEPDAHLHPSLQQHLVLRIGQISDQKQKQVLLATHSSELIRGYDFEKILALRKDKREYLGANSAKIGVLAGIGTLHTESLHALIEHKKLLIIEGTSDERFLRTLCGRAGIDWPKNLIPWFWTGKHSERMQLYRQLKKEIPELVAVSIRDRDDEADASVDADLLDKGFKADEGFIAMKWRRRHIENYLFSAAAIARCTGKTEQEVKNLFAEHHGLVLPDDTTTTDLVIALRDARGKEIMLEHDNSVEKKFKCSRDDIAKQMDANEIAEDLKTFFAKLVEVCA